MVGAPIEPPLAFVVVKMIVTPALVVQVVHSSVPPESRVKSPSVIQYVPGDRLTVTPLTDNPPEICVFADNAVIVCLSFCRSFFSVLAVTMQLPGYVSVAPLRVRAAQAVIVEMLVSVVGLQVRKAWLRYPPVPVHGLTK